MIAFSGCTKEEIKNPVSETKTIQFVAESIETKTAFGTPDGNTYPTLWTENDKSLKLLLNLNEEIIANITSFSPDFTSAVFNADVKIKDEDGSVAPYTFSVISPADVYLGKNNERFAVTIPTTQKPTENSVDEAAQILYAVSDSYEKLPESVSLHFKHFTAYGKLSFVNLNLGDAKVTSVAITSSVNFANRWNYFVANESFGENSGASTITLNTSATENLWFACAPVGDMNGKTLTFTVNTDKGPLEKKVTLGEKHKFEAGKIANMTVDMTGIEFAKSKVYELVTDATDLTVDSEIIIVASDSNNALSTTQNSNNRGQAAITKSDVKSTITDPGNDVQVITIEDGTKDGTIAFNVGNGYLFAANSAKNYLRTETTKSDNSSWSVTIENGIATVKAQGTNTRNWLRYNSTDKMFSCYGSGQNDISIYKLQGSGTVLENYLKVSKENIEVEADATSALFTVNSDLEWTATSENASAVTYEDNSEDNTVTVTVKFPANTNADKKFYTVTVSADGVEPVTVTITQKGYVDPSVVEKKTIAEFKALADGDTVYELEGRISSIAVPYDSGYNNMSFYIVDETGDEMQIYRMSCEGVINPETSITVGDKIIVQGTKGSYGGQPQMAQGGVYISHEDGANTPVIDCIDNTVTITADTGAAIYYTTNGETPTDASTPYIGEFTIKENQTVKAIAIEVGKLSSLVASRDCEYVDPSVQVITESLSIIATEGVLASDNNSISWTGTNFICTNVKGTTAIRTSDTDHYRVYQNSTFKLTTIEKKFTKVVITCTSASYATTLKTSAANSNYTASVSGSVVTITCATPVDEISVKASAQFRINKVEATLQ